MKKIFIPVVVAALAVTACSDWTTPQNIQYKPQSPAESDPEGYAAALAAVRAYKETAHNVMVVTMDGTSEKPVARPQHLMNMPDSADIICVKNAVGLHSSLVEEIAQVYAEKGTKSVVFVDYSAIDAAWTVLEDERAENGKPAGTLSEAEKFFKEKAKEQIDACDRYGFAGLMVSYEGNVATEILQAKQKGFLDAAAEWYAAHKDALLMIRGSIRNISKTDYNGKYKEMLAACRYFVVIAGEISAPRQLSLLAARTVTDASMSDRVLMEVSVPSADTPEQQGASPLVAAQWVLDEKNNRDFTPLGICVGNADDDYYRQDMIYKNVRRAILIMNPSEAE